jgi:hypothetical protein
MHETKNWTDKDGTTLSKNEQEKTPLYFTQKIQSAHFRWVGRVRANKANFDFGLVCDLI